MVEVRRVVGHLRLEVLSEQRRPRLPQDGSGDLGCLVDGDEQLLKEALVSQAPHLRPAEAVHLVAAADQGKRPVQGVLDLGIDHLGRGKDAFGLSQLASNPHLFLPGQVLGDGAGHDATGQPPPLLIQFGDPGTGVGDLGCGPALLGIKFGTQALPDRLLHGFWEPHRLVVLLDGLLNIGGGQVGLRADGPALVPAETEEVEVLSLGVGKTQPAAAVGAEDAALEVVVVDALLLTGAVVGAQHLLHPVEQRLWDEGLVATLVLDALERDQTEVVAVVQQVGDVGGLYGAGELLAVGQGAQPFRGEGFGEGADRPFAAGVGLERPLHERGAVRVDHDCTHLPTVDTPSRVQVPDGCPARGAADLGFLRHALEGFSGEVAAVELGDAGHDGV